MEEKNVDKISKNFLDYDLSFSMKEIGFLEPCLASYYTKVDQNVKEGYYDYRGRLNGLEFHESDNDYLPNLIINGSKDYYISAPLYDQVFDWFSDNYKIFTTINYYGKDQYFYEILNYKGNDMISNPELDEYDWGKNNTTFFSKKETKDEAIKKLIELIQK